MTSKAKIAANRRNAARSTGPRTSAGKARSRRNALWHGLSSPVNPSHSVASQIASLADTIRSISGVPAGIAQLIAEARIELLRVRKAITDAIALSEQAGRADEVLSDEARAAHAAAASLPKLAALVRYERRALSRLNKALRLVDIVEKFEALATSSPPVSAFAPEGRSL
jgi:hypothetical protein